MYIVLLPLGEVAVVALASRYATRCRRHQPLANTPTPPVASRSQVAGSGTAAAVTRTSSRPYAAGPSRPANSSVVKGPVATTEKVFSVYGNAAAFVRSNTGSPFHRT